MSYVNLKKKVDKLKKLLKNKPTPRISLALWFDQIKPLNSNISNMMFG